MRARENAVEVFGCIVRNQVIQHHDGALLHRRVFRPRRQIRHGKQKHTHVVRAIVLALSAPRGEPDPAFDPFRRFAQVLLRRFSGVPLFAILVRPHLRHQIQARVIQKPVILCVATVRHVGFERPS
jgi:hypothetical protein